MEKVNPKTFGWFLAQQPFEIWLRFMFKQISGSDFVREPLHDKIFNTFQNIYDMNEEYTFTNLNLPPRSAKTVSTCYFIVYAILNNPNCKFIYLSYSAKLLKEISGIISKIFESKAFNLFYSLEAMTQEETEEDFISSYWRDYYEDVQKKEKVTFSAKEITIGNAKIILSPLGGQITGFGAGVRSGQDKYSGGIFMDDIEKIQDTINSEVIRDKTHSYFQDVVFSRRNNPKVNITNVQQRICIQDMSSFLEELYGFKAIKAPLEIDGVCQLPTQYDERTLKMHKVKESTWMAQYQQEPILDGGNLLKKEWFDHIAFNIEFDEYERIWAVVDASNKEKEVNDFYVISVFGLKDKKLHLIEVFREKIQGIDGAKHVENTLYKYYTHKGAKLHYCWVEDKSSGISLIQGFDRYNSFVKMPKKEEQKEYMKRDVNKVARANEVLPYINSVNKNILINTNISCYNEILNELVSFPNGKHDDFVDTLVDGIRLYERYYLHKTENYDKALAIMRSRNNGF